MTGSALSPWRAAFPWAVQSLLLVSPRPLWTAVAGMRPKGAQTGRAGQDELPAGGHNMAACVGSVAVCFVLFVFTGDQTHEKGTEGVSAGPSPEHSDSLGKLCCAW